MAEFNNKSETDGSTESSFHHLIAIIFFVQLTSFAIVIAPIDL